MGYIYVLQSLKDKQFYVGYSNNLKKRVKDHNEGKVSSTKFRRLLKFDLDLGFGGFSDRIN